jgi:hypothetical protein
MMAAAIVAHANGTGWDEVLVFALPVVVLVVLQVLGRRRARDAGADGADDGGRRGGGGDDEGPGTGGDAPLRDAP